MRIFVGSLSYGVDDNQLKEFFAPVGTVVSASVITDRHSGQSKGFGFVEMSSDEEAKEAIKQLNGKELDGRAATVNEAKPKEDRPQSSYGGGGGGYNRGGGGYNNRRY
ncbi:RNA-binding protein [Candidatus Saccharibacteria bacterium RIFCSPHIGHO2_01_FULL_48_12]|nr:MAG: RNA-binding protein [Candidatus Saccharibacteria bacterium RIFCSPHIGHO2_01_FULL_48_12]OGL34957.1 MAG: RNA-binding protein [Candidatus Saccharibacteria bacterium RIFCSPHIGHO2_12_FULL_48_21]